jgi:hypothetical protein
MRLVLEKEELIKLIGQALGYNLDESDVKITTDPFELEIKNVRTSDIAEKPPKPAPMKVQESAPVPPSSGNPGIDGHENLDDLLSTSENLANAGLPSEKIDPDSRGLNDFSRPLLANESEDPPSEDFSGEIPG